MLYYTRYINTNLFVEGLGFLAGTTCHFTSFKLRELPNFLSNINESCIEAEESCSEECVHHLKSYKSHPCIQSTPEGLFDFIMTRVVMTRTLTQLTEPLMTKCKIGQVLTTAAPPTRSPCETSHATSSNMCSLSYIIISMLLLTTIDIKMKC